MQLATQQLQLQNGVLHVTFFLQLFNATFVALQVARKIASCNMALTVDCFLEVILSIYRFKRVNFLFENGIVESKTCEQYGRHNSGQEDPF